MGLTKIEEDLHTEGSTAADPVNNNMAAAETAQAQPESGQTGISGSVPAGVQNTVPVRRTFPLDEKVIALLMLIPAYLYIFGLFRDIDAPFYHDELYFTYLLTFRICFGIFVAAFVAFAEVLYRKEKFRFEAGVWLLCLLLTTVRIVFGTALAAPYIPETNVWEEAFVFFFAHAFGIYYVLARSGRLARYESSRLFFFDAMDGAFIIPFKRFILQVQAIIHIFRDREKGGEKKKGLAVLWTLLALIAAVILLVIAVRMLAQADARFEKVVADFLKIFDVEWGEYILYFILSIPVGLYVFGLLAGMRHETRAHVEGRANGFLRFINALGKVPPIVWTILLFVFSAVYLLFFVIQGQYLFGAFVGRLPEGFTLSGYARQGFFELCQVMAVNFVLLWLSMRTSRCSGEKRSPALVAAEVVILVAGILFAAIAFSKLALYIGEYGFTELRIKSTWLVAVLFAGCVCTLVHLLSGKKTMRIWVILSGVTLAAQCLL